jgi:uncharacterized membrane protein YbhN (UPF0104 family)
MQITIWQLYQASIVALFTNQLVPLAGISGNIFFYNFLRGEKISVQNIIRIVIVELLTFYVAAALIILVALAVYLSFYKTTLLLIIMLIAGVFIYALFGFCITLIGKRRNCE